MINKEVIPAFDMLLEELERIIPQLNQQGSQLMDAKNYSAAHAIINKAQAVVSFQDKVKALRAEWESMNIPATRKIPDKPFNTHPMRMKMGTSKKGKRTSEAQFMLPILHALVDLGGRGTMRQVLEKLEVSMADELNAFDWQSLPSNDRVIRWKNTAAWARQKLVYEGYLANDSPTGFWEITPAGREVIIKSKKNV